MALDTSPYEFRRSEGYVHIQLKSKRDCIACVPAAAFDIIWAEAQREAAPIRIERVEGVMGEGR